MFRFASSSKTPDNSVRVTLQCSTNGVPGAAIRHPTRQLKLLSGGSVITIGRASKSSAKALQPTPQNAFFDCAVMSRNHAELYLKGRDVMLRDTKSLHGTLVNDKRVETETVLYPGDLIKLGDAVTRLQSIHEGIQVRVDITRPEQILSQSTQTSTMRTNVFKVPSDVDDDEDNVPNKETLDDYDQGEENDHHSSTNDDEPVTVTAARKSVFSRFLVEDDAAHSSGLSQQNPVVIDDEDLIEMVQAQPASASASASHAVAESVHSELADLDTDDSEIEYGNDDEDCVSIASGPASPRSHTRSQRRAEAYLTDEESDEAFSPDQPTEMDMTIPETEPVTGAPQLDVSQKLFPADRTLPNPETFRTGSIPAPIQPTDSGNVLPPIGHLSTFTSGHAPMTTQMAWDYQPEQMGPDLRSYSPFSYMYNNNSRQFQSSYPAALPSTTSYSGYGHRISATMPDKAATGYPQVFTDTIPESAPEQQSMFEAAELVEPVSTDAVLDKVDSPVDVDVTLAVNNDGESRKRKRAEDDVAEADDAEFDDAEVDDTGAGDEVVVDSMDLTAERGAEVTKLRVDSVDQGWTEVVEEQVAEAVARPAKRARTSSVSLALTAAAGAFGGCVATVGFLWSPLAEKLLA